MFEYVCMFFNIHLTRILLALLIFYSEYYAKYKVGFLS